MSKKKAGVYEGVQTSEISFPLGGIGSGCVGLSGNGRLVDWELFNRPNKGVLNGFSHFAIKAERDGKVLDARVLQGDLMGPRSGNGTVAFGGFGFGPDRCTMAGLPHFRKVSFEGRFPFANLSFEEPAFPGGVRMTAFNPLIPLNDVDSSIPAAFFEFEVTNPGTEQVDYTIAFTVKNPNRDSKHPNKDKTVNRLVKKGALTLIQLANDTLPSDDIASGDMSLGTDATEVSVQEYWFRGAWFDNLGVWWRDFTAPGPLPVRTYPADSGSGQDHAALAVRITVPAGKTGKVRFVMTWNYPNVTNYWSPEKKPECGSGCECKPATWKNYYATRFQDSTASAQYSLENWRRLYSETLRFKDALFASTLPEAVLDAVSANISILKTPTVLRLEDGSFYGFEGCRAGCGCCEGSCQHVWNYAYALPFLFPKLERSMREIEYRHTIGEDGGMAFRVQLPIGRVRSGFRPCADGQFGTVMKMYREWKISGNTDWLKQWWPGVRKSIEFAWAPTNTDKWDPEKTGVLWGRQHHTLDVELFGPNSWLTGFYLGALKAGAEMAEACGEPAVAAEYRKLFAKGKEWVDTHLFNGEYYHQNVDIKNRALLEPFGDANQYYWDEEHKEIKYQILEGSGIDQVVAQWHANLMGLGDLFDPKQTRKALKSIYRYNFKPSMRNFANFCRLYCIEDEAGTVMFDWPEGKYKPVIPMTYAEETMHGFEYQVASHMIQEGMVKEAVELVKAVRDRYDGRTRNPWNEIECGSNYARSMASYALLNAFSGFSFNMSQQVIGFKPVRLPRTGFRCFWSLDSGWGEVEFSGASVTVRVLGGELVLDAIDLPVTRRLKTLTVQVGGQTVTVSRKGVRIRFASTAVIAAGCELNVGDTPEATAGLSLLRQSLLRQTPSSLT